MEQRLECVTDVQDNRRKQLRVIILVQRDQRYPGIRIYRGVSR